MAGLPEWIESDEKTVVAFTAETLYDRHAFVILN